MRFFFVFVLGLSICLNVCVSLIVVDQKCHCSFDYFHSLIHSYGPIVVLDYQKKNRVSFQLLMVKSMKCHIKQLNKKKPNQSSIQQQQQCRAIAYRNFIMHLNFTLVV